MTIKYILFYGLLSLYTCHHSFQASFLLFLGGGCCWAFSSYFFTSSCDAVNCLLSSAISVSRSSIIPNSISICPCRAVRSAWETFVSFGFTVFSDEDARVTEPSFSFSFSSFPLCLGDSLSARPLDRSFLWSRPDIERDRVSLGFTSSNNLAETCNSKVNR